MGPGGSGLNILGTFRFLGQNPFMSSRIPLPDAAWRTRLQGLLRGVTVLCGLGTLGLLVLVVGWPLTEASRALARTATTWLLAVFVGQEAVRVLVQVHPWAFIREHRLELLLTAAVALELVLGGRAVAWLGARTSMISASTLALLFMALNQLTVVGLIALRALRSLKLFHSRTLSPGLVFILSFAGLIGLGALLLKTPQASHGGLSWVDALFLSTSAVCVTGLTPLDISTVLTAHGQWVLLGLIQAGGLGVMTLTYFFAYFMAGGVSLRSRVGLQDLLSEDNLGQIGMVLALIVGFTATLELAGALFIHASLADGPLAGEGLSFFALFHSVSAFCNAGFSTLGPGLADPRVATETGFLSVIMMLIVMGGLGFPVVKSFYTYLRDHLRYRMRYTRSVPARLSANSRIVLWTTVMLLVGGTLAIWVTEFLFGVGPKAGSSGFTALFHSVTARTAGFAITDVQGAMPATVALLILLMFVGGSPSSTAGGIKTSTLAVAVLSLKRVLLGRHDIEAYHRRFSDELANRALSIILVAAAFLAIITVSLCVLHPELPPFDLLFEAVSAVGTVGLTRGITPQLGAPAKLLLVLAMLVGRVGVLTFVGSLLPPKVRPAFRYPETTIILN